MPCSGNDTTKRAPPVGAAIGREDDVAAVLDRQLARDRQAEPGAHRLGRDVRLEDRLAVGVADTAAVVVDRDRHDVARRIGRPADHDIARRAGFLPRVDAVLDEVREHALEQQLVGAHGHRLVGRRKRHAQRHRGIELQLLDHVSASAIGAFSTLGSAPSVRNVSTSRRSAAISSSTISPVSRSSWP